MKKKTENKDYSGVAAAIGAAAGTGAAVVGAELVHEMSQSEETDDSFVDDFVEVIEVIENSHDIPVVPQENVVVPDNDGDLELDNPPCMYGGPIGGFEEVEDIDNPPCMYGGPMEYFDDDI